MGNMVGYDSMLTQPYENAGDREDAYQEKLMDVESDVWAEFTDLDGLQETISANVNDPLEVLASIVNKFARTKALMEKMPCTGVAGAIALKQARSDLYGRILSDIEGIVEEVAKSKVVYGRYDG